MTAIAEKICIEALSLPNETRAEIAERLLWSLDEKEPETAVSAAWKGEIQRRRTEIAAGSTKLIPAEEVLRKALQAIE